MNTITDAEMQCPNCEHTATTGEDLAEAEFLTGQRICPKCGFL
jgi:RNA polymerase subunit RPABC4/transcription elongation factor Spt4